MSFIDRIFGQVKEQANLPAVPVTQVEQSETNSMRIAAQEANRELERVANAKAPAPVAVEDPNAERDWLAREINRGVRAAARDMRARQSNANKITKAQDQLQRNSIAQLGRMGVAGDTDYEPSDPGSI